MRRRDASLETLKSAALCAALCLCAGAATAQEVTITSAAGGLSLTGRIAGFDGTYLQIASPHGPLTVVYDRVQCEGAACPDRENHVPDLRISGEPRITEVLLPGLIEGFARAEGLQVQAAVEGERARYDLGTLRISVHGTSSEEGLADLAAFEADLAFTLRSARADEIARAGEAGIGRLDAPEQAIILGLDGLVPVVSPVQSVTALSLADLSRLFRGRIAAWADLGGTAAPVTLHLGPAQDGQVQYFLDQLNGPAAAITHHGDAAAVVAAVLADPAALGVVSAADIGAAQPVTLRDSCGFVAVPRPGAIKAQDYPLVAPLFVYRPAWRLHPQVGAFLAFLRSPEAQLIVRRARFVDQGIVPIPLDAQGQRFASAIAAAGPEVPLAELQRMVGVMAGLTRQSVSFRFTVGDTVLEPASEAQLRALAYAIRDGAYDGRTIWLLGFSDGQGEAARNLDLSARRAEAVAAELRRLLGQVPARVGLRTDAFGEALPLGCDDTRQGRQTNRRVELWVSEQPL